MLMADIHVTNTIEMNVAALLSSGLQQKIQKQLDIAGQIVENDAKRNCPVDDGTLRASITHVTFGNTCMIGTAVEYAGYVEKGTGLYAADGNGRKEVPWRYQTPDGKWHSTEGQKPKPYLQPAIDNNLDKIKQTLSEVFK